MSRDGTDRATPAEPVTNNLSRALGLLHGVTPPQTRFKILWQHDGARQLEVVIDADLAPFAPMEQRIRSIAAIASSHGGLRLLLDGAFGEQWHIGVFEAVGGVTGVHLAPTART